MASRTSLKYLGVVVSCKKFEDLTLRYRSHCALATRQSLTKILHASRHLSLNRRLELYFACVRSAVLYGIAVTGLSRRGVHQLCSFQIRHIRAIARAPGHITLESNAAFLERLGHCTPVEAIVRQLRHSIKRGKHNDWRTDPLERLHVMLVAFTSWHSGQCPTC